MPINNYASLRQNVNFCVIDPSNRTYYTGGEMLEQMYKSCSNDMMNITCDIFAIAYHHFPGMKTPVTLKQVDQYIKDTNPPNYRVTPFVDKAHLPSAIQIATFIRSQYHAMVIGGSDDSATDDSMPYISLFNEVLQILIREDFPIMGYCWGGQILARASHSKTNVTRLEDITGKKGGEYGFISYQMTAEARNCKIFENVPETFVSSALHNDCFMVDERELLLTSIYCPHSGFKVHNKRVFGFQFHLDFTREESEKFFTMQSKTCAETKII
ncbi:GMP synthase subunit A [Acrasis kona]|uniref:GMP synthase subunit A n=1 Tax=Acrasis kona TaxID=1008807 RepID=A0AAW2YVV9_9EUKA